MIEFMGFSAIVGSLILFYSIFKPSKKPKVEAVKENRYESKTVNVGKVTIKLEFQDGRIFFQTIYGDLAYDGGTFEGIWLAKDELRRANTEETSYIDDTKNPTKSIIGKVISKEITNVEDYFVTRDVLVRE